MRRGTSWILRLMVVVAVVALAAACAKTDKETGPAPEDKRATPAEVAAGLGKIEGFAKDVAQAGSDKAKAKAADELIEPQWQLIEGTVKANSKDLYLAFEDSFALLENAAKDGDAAKAAKGSTDVSKAVTQYLATYPG